MNAKSARPSAAMSEWLERPLAPRISVVACCIGCFVVVAIAAEGSEGRMVKALTLHVGHKVPEGSCVVVVSYVRHDGCCVDDESRVLMMGKKGNE